MKKIFVLVSMVLVHGFAVEQGQDILQKTPLDYLREIDQKKIQSNTVLPDAIKKTLLIKLRAVLCNPGISVQTAHLVLKDCTACLFYCRYFLEQKIPVHQDIEKAINSRSNMMHDCSEAFYLLHNLCLYFAQIYFEGNIPEGILDIAPESTADCAPEPFPRLVHLKTLYGPVFFSIPFVEAAHAIKYSYARELSIFSDRTIKDVDLIYSSNQANHSSGFYFDLNNSNGYLLAFGAYRGAPHYHMGSSHVVFTGDDLGVFNDPKTFESSLKKYKPLIGFAMSRLRNKIGDFLKLKELRTIGELIFLPFPIMSGEQTEAAYAEDLFQAQEALADIERTNFLLGAIPEFVEDKAKQAENAEKRERILTKKREAEAKLVRLNAEYQTTTETLVSTIEGKLLSLHEAEYQQLVADEQAKIAAQLNARSQPGVMAGKKLSRREKEQTKQAELAEKKWLEEELATVQQKVRAEFIAKIKGRYDDKRHVLKSFHEHLAANGIHFYETQDGSHRITHVEGAKSVTVVEEHKGSAPFAHYSGKTILHMLNVFGDALKQKTLGAATAREV
jgi:hypothetical protein